MTNDHAFNDPYYDEIVHPSIDPTPEDELLSILQELEFLPSDQQPAARQAINRYIAASAATGGAKAPLQALRRFRAAAYLARTGHNFTINRQDFKLAPSGIVADLHAIRTIQRRGHAVVSFRKHPLCYYPRPIQRFIKLARKLDRAITFLSPDPLAFSALGILSLILLIAFAAIAPAQAPSLKALDHPSPYIKQFSDKEPRIKPKILFTTAKSFTLVLKDCRENDKQHVSCQFTDPTGKDHWVYIPGLTIPHDR